MALVDISPKDASAKPPSQDFRKAILKDLATATTNTSTHHYHHHTKHFNPASPTSTITAHISTITMYTSNITKT
jgi:hypothetical protein